MIDKYEDCKVQSIGKARMILDVVEQNRAIGLSELSKQLGMNKSTVFALADSLKSIGFLDQIKSNGKYTLGLGLLQLSSHINVDIKNIAHPYMEILSEKYKENVNLTGFQDTYITYLDQIESLYAVRVVNDVGRKMELNSSAVGKAILANLPETEMLALIETIPFTRFTDNTITNKTSLINEIHLTAERGYGINNEESWLDVYTIGVAIIGADNRPIGGLSIDAPKSRMNNYDHNEIISDLRQYAAEIHNKLFLIS